MITPDQVKHIVFVPDLAFEKRVIDAIEAAVQDPEVPRRALALLAKSLRPRKPGPWKGPRASRIAFCERGQVLEAWTPERTFTAGTILTFSIGHFIHALLQAHFPDAPTEETWRGRYLIGHSDQRFHWESRMLDDKSSGTDGVVAVRNEGKPKLDHVFQTNFYAVMAGCEWATILYVNKNGRLTSAQRSSQAWRGVVAQYAARGQEPNELLAAFTFRADPELAREADEKARRIREHVAAGTVPAYDPAPEMLRRGGDCQYCPVKAKCHALRDLDGTQSDEPGAETWTAVEHGPDGFAYGVRCESWPTKVVGTTFVPGGVDFDSLAIGDMLDLEWEPENPEGPRLPDGLAQSVLVIHRRTGKVIGHLNSSGSTAAADVSIHLRRLGLRDGRNGAAQAEITALTGGTEDKLNRGINIRVTLTSRVSATTSIPPGKA